MKILFNKKKIKFQIYKNKFKILIKINIKKIMINN